MPTIDLRADLHTEEDRGGGGACSTTPPTRGRCAGRVLIAGTDRFWSAVQMEQVDDDGQVHFVAVPLDDPAATRLLARSG